MLRVGFSVVLIVLTACEGPQTSTEGRLAAIEERLTVLESPTDFSDGTVRIDEAAALAAREAILLHDAVVEIAMVMELNRLLGRSLSGELRDGPVHYLYLRQQLQDLCRERPLLDACPLPNEHPYR